MSQQQPLINRLTDRLFQHADGAALAVFRIMFGVIMTIECYRFVAHGWIERYYIAPDFQFKYWGFAWVTPLPGDGMYYAFGLLAICAICMALGLFYRVTIVVLWLLFTYVFLLEQARYLNHFYFGSLLLFLMMLVPANRVWSVDAWLAQRRGAASETVPWWSYWLLRAQMEIMLVYAGVVKINWDWLRGEPLGMWLSREADTPLIGWLYNYDWVVYTASYGTIAIHLVGAPLLLIRKTRLWALVIYSAFHLSNHFMFQIGIFPWLTIAATLLFLDPNWPRELARWLADRTQRSAAATPPVNGGTDDLVTAGG